MSEQARATSPLGLIIAWALVGIPLLWGVWETLRNALKLLR
jgi:hypothetical protein